MGVTNDQCYWRGVEFRTRLVLFMVLCSIGGQVAAEDRSMDRESLQEEIRLAEKAFADMARERGVREAFLAFAAEDAVLNRDDRIISGKEAIREYFDQQTLKDVELSWAPEYIDVSVSGDLGWTWGNYQFRARDKDGNLLTSEGIFHTVWKRQADGSWKFVWD